MSPCPASQVQQMALVCSIAILACAATEPDSASGSATTCAQCQSKQHRIDERSTLANQAIGHLYHPRAPCHLVRRSRMPPIPSALSSCAQLSRHSSLKESTNCSCSQPRAARCPAAQHAQDLFLAPVAHFSAATTKLHWISLASAAALYLPRRTSCAPAPQAHQKRRCGGRRPCADCGPSEAPGRPTMRTPAACRCASLRCCWQVRGQCARSLRCRRGCQRR